jgi:hypothetical protein
MQCVENVSGYKGSSSTFALVKKIIEERYGPDLANEYLPEKNCMTFKRWLTLGYRVKKGEKSIKSYTVIKDKDEENERKYFKPVHLFYFTQVEEIKK